VARAPWTTLSAGEGEAAAAPPRAAAARIAVGGSARAADLVPVEPSRLLKLESADALLGEAFSSPSASSASWETRHDTSELQSSEGGSGMEDGGPEPRRFPGGGGGC
jgi:hypothetical protein